MKSILFQPTTPFPGTYPCPPGRNEQPFKLYQNGYTYSFVVRDKVVPEDLMLVLMKAYAFSIKYAVPYPGGEPPRVVRDYLIKNSVSAL